MHPKHWLISIQVWIDKFCIDQTSIADSLMCLPVFLAGCKQLLVLAGPTYATRLWCVMELFVFLRMGGQREDIVVKLLGDGNATAQLSASLASFDAGKAACFHDADKQKLWAVIESTFGTFTPFNKLVRATFADQQRRGKALGSWREMQSMGVINRSFRVVPPPVLPANAGVEAAACAGAWADTWSTPVSPVCKSSSE